MTGVDITEIERMLVLGLAARDREVQRDYVAPMRADMTVAYRSIEDRLGLAAGALGTTHGIDMASWAVVPLATGSDPAAPQGE